MRVNLIKEQKKKFSINWMQLGIFLTSVIVFVFMIFIYYNNLNQLNKLKEEVINLDQQLKITLPKKQDYLKLQKEIDKLKETKKEVQLAAYRWDNIIKEHGYLIPDNVMFKYMHVEEGIVAIEGMAANNVDVIKLINNMKASALFSHVKLLYLNKQQQTDFRVEAAVAVGSD